MHYVVLISDVIGACGFARYVYCVHMFQNAAIPENELPMQ